MRIEDAPAHLAAAIAGAGETIAARLDAVIAFYRDQRADGCVIEDDGDMLLFQWGPGHAGGFEVDITRQLMPVGQDDPLQLHLTARFAAREDRAGHIWCASPAAIDAFRAEISGKDVYRALAGSVPEAWRQWTEQC
jgi:hypothetical protein